VRGIVRDYIAPAIRKRPELEQIHCRASGVPGERPADLRRPAGLDTRDQGRKDHAPVPGRLPEVDVAIAMQVSTMARTRRDRAGQEMRPFLLDVALDAVGTVRGAGYDVVPQGARLVAWWGG
jgi:hypothetical protein